MKKEQSTMTSSNSPYTADETTKQQQQQYKSTAGTTTIEKKSTHQTLPIHCQVQVDVIIPVHNSSMTIKEAVQSAMNQEIPPNLLNENYEISVVVCCYDDGSTDDSWPILQQLLLLSQDYSCGNTNNNNNSNNNDNSIKIPTKLLIGQGNKGIGRGAGFARNRAIELNNKSGSIDGDDDDQQQQHHYHFLCLLDSDDIMHQHRIAYQTHYMLTKLTPSDRIRCILGCTFDRDPPDSTWHYSSWANSLSDSRLILEKFRELTVLQPTWFLCRSRWESLGGYIEASITEDSNADNSNSSGKPAVSNTEKQSNTDTKRLIHPIYDNDESLKLAEDLRFFHEHLEANGILKLHRSPTPLVTYRHASGTQSYRTGRKLLLQLRVLAFERSILQPTNNNWWWAIANNGKEDDDCKNQIQQQQRFIVWGAGRDGKDFVKALSKANRSKIYCFVDVDTKKLNIGRYTNRDIELDVPIIHFSFLIKDQKLRQQIQYEYEEGLASNNNNNNNAIIHGRIDKTNPKTKQKKKQRTDSETANGDDDCDDKPPKSKKQKRQQNHNSSLSSKLDIRGLSQQTIQECPVVVCVAMYRTNGVLEKNVQTIGRTEGYNLWHFC